MREKLVPLGKYWRTKPLVFFVAAALPGTARVAEVDLHVGSDRKALVGMHLLALVPRQRTSQLPRQFADVLRRDAGAMPPWSVTIRKTPVLFLRSSAREIAAALDPLFQRSHSSAFCAAVNHIRDVTMSHPLIQ